MYLSLYFRRHYMTIYLRTFVFIKDTKRQGPEMRTDLVTCAYFGPCCQIANIKYKIEIVCNDASDYFLL